MNNATEPGHWYWWWVCHACHEAIPFMECTEDATISGDGSMQYDVPCLDCGKTDKYSSRELIKAQVPHPAGSA